VKLRFFDRKDDFFAGRKNETLLPKIRNFAKKLVSARSRGFGKKNCGFGQKKLWFWPKNLCLFLLQNDNWSLRAS
jgi:hypothetical protein